MQHTCKKYAGAAKSGLVRNPSQLPKERMGMKIPVMYHIDQGSRINLWFWRVTSILFMSLSLFLGFVAMHNAKPIQCDDIVYNNNVKVCEVIIKGGQ